VDVGGLGATRRHRRPLCYRFTLLPRDLLFGAPVRGDYFSTRSWAYDGGNVTWFAAGGGVNRLGAFAGGDMDAGGVKRRDVPAYKPRDA